jgi:hypothetical protein
MPLMRGHRYSSATVSVGVGRRLVGGFESAGVWATTHQLEKFDGVAPGQAAGGIPIHHRNRTHREINNPRAVRRGLCAGPPNCIEARPCHVAGSGSGCAGVIAVPVSAGKRRASGRDPRCCPCAVSNAWLVTARLRMACAVSGRKPS